MNTDKTTKENSNLPIFSVSISSLIDNANKENSENKRKTLSNLGKPTKYIEPYDNTHFLNMISGISDALN